MRTLLLALCGVMGMHATISNVSVNPAAQPAMNMPFTMFAQSNTGTTAHMAFLYVMVANSNTNPQGQAQTACILQYALPQANGGYDDLLSTGGHGGPSAWLHHTPPTTISPSSGACSFNSGDVQVSTSGGLLTFQMAGAGLTFPAWNTGLKTLWAYIGTMSEVPNEELYPWTVVGTFTVGAPPPPLPTTELVSMTPGGSSDTQTFTFRSVYQGGATNIGWSWFTVDTGVNWPGANVCSWANYPGYYGGLKYGLLNDNGQAATYYDLGTPSSNGQCDMSGVTMSLSGNVATYTATVHAKAGFSGPKVITGFSAKYPNEYGPVLNLGNWTIPTMQDQIIGYVKESPATLNPGEVGMSKVGLSQAGQDLDPLALRVYHVGDPVTFRIRFGRPNQQVWVQRRAMSFVDGAWVNEVLCSPTIGISGHEQAGACLLGSTDGNGFFQWDSTILNSLIGMTTVQFYLGSQTPDPAYPTTTYGPMNENNYIGALVYFVTGVSGFPQPPVW